jgi:putative ABC transport system substrate-binding protein
MATYIRRREFIVTLGGAAAWPLAVRAQQQGRTRRIGALMASARDLEWRAGLTALRNELKALGWVEGDNIHIDERWAGSDMARVRADATELVSLKPDVMFVRGVRAFNPLRQAAGDIPIVFVGVSDPVGQGFVASLARPGGNITGFAAFEISFAGKMLEVLKEVVPSITRVGFVFHPDNSSAQGRFEVIEAVAPRLGVEVSASPFRDKAGLHRIVSEFGREPGGGLVFGPDASLPEYRDAVIAFVAGARVPAVYPYRSFVEKGGLIFYGTNYIDLHRQAAFYIDRILKGEKPADLPVQAPTKYELVINLKTAKALGIEVPATLLARADEVIE